MTVSAHDPKSAAARQTTVLERVYPASRELMFQLFTDPAHLTRWWVPYALTNPVCEFDARPGGKILLVMMLPDGTRYSFKGTVHEVEPPSRLVFSTTAIDPNGAAQAEVRQSVTFTARGGKTVVRLELETLNPETADAWTLRGMEGGWMQGLGKLEFYLLDRGDVAEPALADAERLEVTLPSEREVMVARTFNAPRADVFKALLEPAMAPTWWEQRYLAPAGDQPRPGGEYIEVVHQELVVNAFDLEPRAGYLGLDAVHLLERDGATRLTGISLFPSKKERDRALDAGLARAAAETYDRLAALLTETA